MRGQRKGLETRLKALVAMMWLGESRSLGIEEYPRERWLKETKKHPNHDSQ